MTVATEGPGGGASGGVCLGWRPHLQVEELEVPLSEVAQGRLAFGILSLKDEAKVMLVSVYGYVGIGYNAENLQLLAELGKQVELIGLPWLAGGDWNIEPYELRNWICTMHGCVLEQQVKATCFSSAEAPTMLDYWIVHEDLQHVITGGGADWQAPFATHLCLKAKMSRAPAAARVKRLRVPQSIPVPAKGCIELTWLQSKWEAQQLAVPKTEGNISLAITEGHPRAQEMKQLDRRLQRWAEASELQQLSKTDIERTIGRSTWGAARSPHSSSLCPISATSQNLENLTTELPGCGGQAPAGYCEREEPMTTKDKQN